MSPRPLPAFEFTVAGRPVSHQSHNRPRLAAWRQVTTAAAAEWTAFPIAGLRLRVVVSYYHDGRRL